MGRCYLPNMYRTIFILVFLYTSILSNLSKCEKDKDQNFVKTKDNNGSTTVSVTVTHGNDSQNQFSTHRDEDVKSHYNYTPVNTSGGKLPSWDYGRHGSDWTNGMCKSGVKQSPVDLHVEGLKDNSSFNLKGVYDSVLKGESPDLSSNTWKRGDIVYSYNHYLSTLQVLRSPNVFRLTVPQNEGSTFGALFTTDKPNLYSATHIDFHSPSEHTFDGSANRRQIEMQIWHYLSDSPSSDLGIGSLDLPETTEVNVMITKSVKKSGYTKTNKSEPSHVFHPVQKTFPKSESAQNTVTNKNQYSQKTKSQSNSLNLNNSNSKKSLDISNFNLKSSKDTGYNDNSNAYHDQDDDHENPEFYYESDDHGPSMVQLSQKGVSEDPHPLKSKKSLSYKKLLENDRYDLFNKYLLTHLNNSANNLNNEQTHVKEKKMAREKGTHWGRWAVISLTFMSEEIEKTNIESLKSFPSERFMNEVFNAGSSVNVTDNDSYQSVGDLNTNNSSEHLPVVDLETPLNLSSLFMMLEVKNLNFFAYDGSFTQPGCEETVRWYVAKESLPISTELMLQLHRMLNPNPHVSNPNNYVDNYRELQNVNNKCRNVGKVRFVHGFPMEYFVISPFNLSLGEPSSFIPYRLSILLTFLLFLMSI